MSTTKNKVKVVVSQTIPAYTNNKGVVVEERNYSFEASDETVQDITAEKAGNFLMLNLLKFIELQKLQTQDTFKLSKPIDVSLTVNGKEGKSKMRVSLNRERFEHAFYNAPLILANVFTKVTNIGSLTNSEAQKFMKILPAITNDGETVQAERICFAGGSTLLAKRIEKIETIEIPVVD